MLDKNTSAWMVNKTHPCDKKKHVLNTVLQHTHALDKTKTCVLNKTHLLNKTHVYIIYTK